MKAHDKGFVNELAATTAAISVLGLLAACFWGYFYNPVSWKIILILMLIALPGSIVHGGYIGAALMGGFGLLAAYFSNQPNHQITKYYLSGVLLFILINFAITAVKNFIRPDRVPEDFPEDIKSKDRVIEHRKNRNLSASGKGVVSFEKEASGKRKIEQQVKASNYVSRGKIPAHMGKASKGLKEEDALKRWKEISALWYEWNPLDVQAGSEAMKDKYDKYLGASLLLLENGASIEELSNYLKSVAENYLDLTESDQLKPEEFAVKLKNWYQKNWQDNVS